MPLPLLISDRTDLTIADIRRMGRREIAHRKTALVLVDYLQLVGGAGKTEAKRVYEVGEVSRGLEAMAKELNIPVIALAQLNRSVESRDDKRPLLSDLRDSGNIEQDADVVILLYREKYYLRAAEPSLSDADYAKWLDEMAAAYGVCEAIIAKNRFGPAGKVARLSSTRRRRPSRIWNHASEPASDHLDPSRSRGSRSCRKPSSWPSPTTPIVTGVVGRR
jgi:replicative DNA helicase